MSTHRNSNLEDYIPAVRAITDRGGFVIRLGDSGMRPFPGMPRVIDYAHSAHKSPSADIFLCGTSRFIVGTTSGLTTVSLCFGTPMLLVNCISNDWQLWTAGVDFILKRLWSSREKRFLSLRETYSDPIQGYLMNAHIMDRHGLEAIPNSAEDILKAVIYKLDRLDQLDIPKQDLKLLSDYERAMAFDHAMFGAASPVPRFLADYPDLFGGASNMAV
jgi:putative glycosyltransferase (TIGR04372 family)